MANEKRRTKDRERAKANGPRPLSLKARKAASNRLAAMDDPKLFSGKYSGRRLSEVPMGYLAWWANNVDPTVSLRMEGLMVAVRRFLGIDDTQGGIGRPNGSTAPVPCPGDRTPQTAKAEACGKPDGSLGYRQVDNGTMPVVAHNSGTTPGEDGLPF